MDPLRLYALANEADELLAANPGHFDPPGYDEPPGYDMDTAQALLGEGAPYHRVAHVAHALAADEL